MIVRKGQVYRLQDGINAQKKVVGNVLGTTLRRLLGGGEDILKGSVESAVGRDKEGNNRRDPLSIYLGARILEQRADGS